MNYLNWKDLDLEPDKWSTYYTRVTGADVSVGVIGVCHREVVGLLLQLGEVHLPRLLPGQVTLILLPSSSEWTTEHHILLIINICQIGKYLIMG